MSYRENEAKWEEDSKKNDALCSKHDLRLWLAYSICSDDYVLYMLYYRVSKVGILFELGEVSLWIFELGKVIFYIFELFELSYISVKEYVS